jgi:hypothetical protein
MSIIFPALKKMPQFLPEPCAGTGANSVHWVLDTAFREDDSRLRKGHGQENFAVLRHIALNLLKQEQSKLGGKAKRLKAGWDNKFLRNILTEL